MSGSMATHSEQGEPHAALFAALESLAVGTKLVLQVDVDICIHLREPEDIVGRAARIFRLDTRAVTTLALPIFTAQQLAVLPDFVSSETQRPHRFEIRFSFLHLARFQALLPLSIQPEERSQTAGHILRRGWYHTFDAHMAVLGKRSYRISSTAGFFLHPPNALKQNTVDYLLLVDRVSTTCVTRTSLAPALTPAQEAWAKQSGKVDIILEGGDFFGERAENIIFVCYGCDVPYSTSLNCLSTLSSQQGAEKAGVVVVDDSSNACSDALFVAARQLFPGRVTCSSPGARLGDLQSKNHVIKRVCVNPESVIVILDLGDFLLLQPDDELSVVERIRNCFFRADGAVVPDVWVALGGMACDSMCHSYPFHLLGDVHQALADSGGWHDLRCFKKFLFDAIPKTHFCTDGVWIDHCHSFDYAFMIPIIEQAGTDRVCKFPVDTKLFFHNECLTHAHVTNYGTLNKIGLSRLPLLQRIQRPIEATLRALAICDLPSNSVGELASGSKLKLITYPRNLETGAQCRVYVRGDPGSTFEPVPVRIHSECFSGDVLGSRRCDCKEQIDVFMSNVMGTSENAILVYISGHEGRGNGWDNKAKAYELADLDPTAHHDTLLCSLEGCESDKRDYSEAVDILYDNLQLQRLILYTNNPRKLDALRRRFSSDRLMAKPMTSTLTSDNSKYLHEKVADLGHDSSLIRRQLPDSCDVLVDLALLGVDVQADTLPTMTLLKDIVRGMLEQAPFHNLTMLSAGDDKTDAASLGLCYDRNVWLAQVLECLGFSVRIIGARTRFFMERNENKLLLCRALQMPFDHISLVVRISDCHSDEYLVDVGNGSPYFSPLQLPTMQETNESFRAKHCNIEYRIVQKGSDTFDLEHLKFLEREDWRVNYTFRLSDCLTPEDIKTIIRAHGTDPHFGHFLLGLRINRWRENGSSVIIRDTEAWTLGLDGVEKSHEVLQNGRELDAFVREHFRDTTVPKLLVHAAPILYKYITLMKPAIPLKRVLKSYIAGIAEVGKLLSRIDPGLDGDARGGILFVRHSARDKFPKGSSKDKENSMPLNAEGVALAKRLGDDLGKLQATSKRPIKITFHSSPVLRCIETAELMMERVGMSTATVVECTDLCASPYDGCLDGWKACKEKHGWSKSLNMWLSGIAIPDATCAAKMAEKAVTALDVIFEKEARGGPPETYHLVVAISHDMSCLAVAEHLKFRGVDELDVPFLGGVFISRN